MFHTIVSHLPSVGSDHCPSLLEMVDKQVIPIRYFKFFNCWTNQQSFLETVSNYLNRPTEGNPIWIFHQKIKRLYTTLSSQPKVEFGDIYAKVKEFGEKTRQAKENLINSDLENERTTLHVINAKYIRYLNLEESMLRQKTNLYWFKEGDANSIYFHALTRDRSKRLYIHRIQDEEGNWIQSDDDIARVA